VLLKFPTIRLTSYEALSGGTQSTFELAIGE